VAATTTPSNLTAADRARGGRNTRIKPRTVDPADLPGPAPKTLEDVVVWASWATQAVATGQIDHRTSREIATMLAQLRGGIEKAHLERELRELRATVKRLQEAR